MKKYVVAIAILFAMALCIVAYSTTYQAVEKPCVACADSTIDTPSVNITSDITKRPSRPVACAYPCRWVWTIWGRVCKC